MAKVDLITGFLGSGKTTFIKRYARYLMDKGEKVGIIENDYGAISVDLMLLNEELGDQCGLEMVVAGDIDCYRRRFKTKLISMGMLGYDRVIVEPSGIFDAEEFFDILYEEPLDRWYQIGNVIAIVDACLEEEMSEESEYLLMTQIACAGKILFSKMKDVGGEILTDREDLKNTVAHMNRALQKFQCERGFEYTKECGLSDELLAKPWDELTEEDYAKIENCGYVPKSYVKKRVSEKNPYQSLFYYHVVMTEGELREIVKTLFHMTSFGHVHRIKGFIKTPTDEWLQVNATVTEFNLFRVEQGQEVVIVVGEDLACEKIDELMRRNSHCKDIVEGRTSVSGI